MLGGGPALGQFSEQSHQSGPAHEAHLQTHGSLSGRRPAAPAAAGSVLQLLVNPFTARVKNPKTTTQGLKSIKTQFFKPL